MRTLTYAEALNETLDQLLSTDERVILIGQGVISPWYVGTTTAGLNEKYGPERIIDTPVSENGVTGAALGASLTGLRPIVEHPRMDFMYLAMDQLMNHAANWRYMFGGRVHMPVTVWGIINRGGEQAAQHSQALQAMFAHSPGLKVVMPSTPYDAKGLLIAAVRDDDPVIFIDDRWLYSLEGEVPEELYEVPIGRGVVRRSGRDATVVASSFMVVKALEAAETLAAEGLDIEVLDPRTIKPLDREMILDSVRKTGRLVVVDAAWKTCGFASETAALAAEEVFEFLKAPIRRVTLPDLPAPAAGSLEKAYYIESSDIVEAVRRTVR